MNQIYKCHLISTYPGEQTSPLIAIAVWLGEFCGIHVFRNVETSIELFTEVQICVVKTKDSLFWQFREGRAPVSE